MIVVTWDLLRSRCYVPYSDRKEVCIVESINGIYYPGVRIENRSFPLSIDAVQIAIYSCLSEGDFPAVVFVPDAEPQENSEILLNDSSIHSRSVLEWCSRYSIKPVPLSRPDLLKPERFFKTSEQEMSYNRLQALTTLCQIPNSCFPVTALLRTDNEIYSGVNIEVDDWQKGLCAERIALGKAISSGAKSFHEIHVSALLSDYVSPCGACREVLVEWMSEGTITLKHNEFESTRLFIPALLPYQLVTGNLSKKKH